jgi:hypothetical protein
MKVRPSNVYGHTGEFEVDGPAGGITFKTKEEAQAYIDEKQKGISHNYVIFDDNLIRIINKYYENGRVYQPSELLKNEAQAFIGTVKQAFAGAVSDIKGAVKPVGPYHDLRNAKAIDEINAMLTKDGLARFVGMEIRTIQDVGEIAAAGRHPAVEHLQVILTKGGKVVGSIHHSTGNIGMIDVTARDLADMIDSAMARYNADAFFTSHNHPTGDPAPSGAGGDVDFSKSLAGIYGDAYQGSVVTNHKFFAVIDGKGESTYHAFKEEKQAFRKEGTAVADTMGAARFARGVLQGNMLGVMFLDQKNNILSFDHVDAAGDFNAYVQAHAKAYGAPNVILVTGPAGAAKMKKGTLKGVYLDMIVLRDDGAYMSAKLGHVPGVAIGRISDKEALGIRDMETAAVFQEAARRYNASEYRDVSKTGRLKAGRVLTLRGRLTTAQFPKGLPTGTTGKFVDMDKATGEMLVDFDGALSMVTPDKFKETYRKAPVPEVIPGQPIKRTINEVTGVADMSPEVISTQAKMLALKLASEEKAAREAARAVKAEIMDDLRESKKGEAEIRKSVKDYVTKNVPAVARGKFLSMVSRAKTTIDLGKVMVRADNEAAKISRRTLISDITKVAERALASSRVDVEYKEAVRGLMGGIDLVNRRPETIIKLKAMRAYVDRARKSGRNEFIPDEISKALEILVRQPAAEIAEQRLEVILRDLHIIEFVGKQTQNQKETAAAIDKNMWVDKLASAQAKHIRMATEAGRLSKQWAWAQDVYWSVAPMSVVMDRLDGGKGTYDGAHSQMKEVVSGDFMHFLDMKRQYIQPVMELVQKHGLGEKEMEKIGIYALKVQVNGTARVLATLQELDEAYVNSLTLNDKEMEVYSKMREGMEAIFPTVKILMGKLYNKEVGSVENYFSFMTDWSKLTDMQVMDRLSNSGEEYSGIRKNVAAGFTKARLPKAASPVVVNAMKVYLQHMNDVCYFVAMQENIKKFSEIIKDDRYAEAVGPEGFKIMQAWFDLLARQGKAEGSKRIWALPNMPSINLDTVRKNVGAATLGWKLTSVMIQTTSFFDAASYVGGQNVLSAWHKLVSDPAVRTWLNANFPKLRERVGDDLALVDLSETEWLAKLQQKGYAPMKWLDSIVAASTTLAAYNKYAEDHSLPAGMSGSVDPAGVKYANMVMEKTQASPFFLDAGIMFGSSKYGFGNATVNKAFLQFKQFVVNRWFYASYDIPRMTAGKMTAAYTWLLAATAAEMGIRAGSRTTILTLLGSLGMGIAAGVKGADDDDDLLTDYLIQLLGQIPFMDAPISLFKYGSLPMPVLDAATKVAMGGKDAVGAQTEYRRIKGLQRALQGLASLAGVPGTAQAGQIVSLASNPKALAFPYQTEVKSLEDLGISRTYGEETRYSKLQESKREFTAYSRQYREAMERGDIGAATEAANGAARALKWL